ncbi:MAG: FISUMP domain-containing protein [Bacteroidales bacterium]
MKMKNLFILIFLVSFYSTMQGQTVAALAFTARHDGLHQPLDSIRVANLTRGGDTTLYGTDTLLMLTYGIGISDPGGKHEGGFALLPAYPNPFQGQTTIQLMVYREETFVFRTVDLLGRERILLRQRLVPGHHRFVFRAGKEMHQVLSAETPGQRETQRLMHTGRGWGECSMEYGGMSNIALVQRKERSGFLWEPGDKLQMIGYATPVPGHPASDLYVQSILLSKQVTFQLINGLPCPGMPIVTDTSGIQYRTRAIGNQCWMTENLRTTHYRDGSPIPLVTDNQGWVSLSGGARCWYSNDSAEWAVTYGALYNHPAVDQGNLCPDGWRVPTDNDWLLLEDFLGGNPMAGAKLKASGTAHWAWPNAGASNAVGFTALPGGYRDPGDGSFQNKGISGYWWNSSGHQPHTAWSRNLGHLETALGREASALLSGFSVRCVVDDPATVQLPVKAFFKADSTTVFRTLPVQFIDYSSSNPTSWKWFFGDGSSSTQQHPIHAYNDTGSYQVTLIAGNAMGSDTVSKPQYIQVIPQIPVQVFDIDGNPYDTVHIGAQVWLLQNLRTTRLNNGTPIPLRDDAVIWQYYSNPGRCWFQNDSTSYANLYGALYNSWAATSGNICPTGYHVPNNAEWNTLINYLGGTAVAGGAMKSTGTTLWLSPNTGATNSSRFTAHPGSVRTTSGYYYNAGAAAWFYSSDTYSSTNGYGYALAYNATFANSANHSKKEGYSIRCIRDTITAGCVLPTVVTDSASNITTTTARITGTVGYDGGTAVFARGICISTSPNPTLANNHTVEGVNMGTFYSDFINLIVNTTYYVRAYATNAIGTAYGNQITFSTVSSFTLYDIDGNGYDTVHIGNQVWMKQNLRTRRYNTGVSIPLITYAGGWDGLNTNGMCYYNYDSATYAGTYGALYNFHAVNTGILCPVGWHVPTDGEWSILDNYLGGLSVSGGAMKEPGLLHWNSPNTGATNSSGFLSLPGGNNGLTGLTGGLGNSAHYWSSTITGVSTNAWGRINLYNAASTTRHNPIVRYGYSVRCIQN